MSYTCDLQIPISKIPTTDMRLELYNILLEFRPDYSGLIDSLGMVLEFPSYFNDDPTGDLADFMKKHKLTITVLFTNEDTEDECLDYIAGVLQDDD